MTAAQDLGDRPIRAAGLLISGEVPWPIADLRIDWHDAPIAALGEPWQVWKPQMEAYVMRALHPGEPPSFGVPGDDGMADPRQGL